jgi:hypothetical protein
MATEKPILYNAWISSCSHRVRIALNLKGDWLDCSFGWFLGITELALLDANLEGLSSFF